MKLWWIVCLSISIYRNVESAKILGFFMMPSISHQVVYQAIWRELSLRGHEVTIVSPNILNDPNLTNLTEIDVNFSYEFFTKNNFIPRLGSDISTFKKKVLTLEVTEEIIRAQFEYQPVRQIINDPDRDFDVVLLEGLHPLPLGLGHRFNTPVILISSLDQFVEVHEALGNPTHPVLHPDIFVPPLDEDPSFFQRLSSFLYHLQFKLYYRWIYLPKVDKVAKNYFGMNLPYLGDLQKNVSLAISNKNPFTYNVRANLPNIIEVSQVHLNKKKHPLPNDIQAFLESASDGAIYFSLGSNVKSSELSANIRRTILETLKDLPYKVIWKWEQDQLPNQPENVMIKKWLPQQDILGHPNIKIFITQGGVQSIEEAIANEVPMVVLPVIADQFLNGRKMSERGVAVTLNYRTMTKSELTNSILEVINNEKYKMNIKRIHHQLLDQPVAGLDKAIWWIEYVIRNDGAPYFRNPAIDMPFYKYHMLDVIGLLVLITLIIIVALVKLAEIFRSSKTKKIKLK